MSTKNESPSSNSSQPWCSGPAEILQHGLSLLHKDTDSNRRLAMLSIDNAVELMIKTYLGLPRRVTGLQISRTALAEINESFPNLLDALENHAGSKLDGIDLGEIDWYHRLRNQLYHQGNGLTVVREKVVVYAELAKLLFQRLFGFAIEVEEPDRAELVGAFVGAWASMYVSLERLAREQLPAKSLRGAASIVPQLVAHGILDRPTEDEIHALRALRNNVVHGDARELHREDINRVLKIRAVIGQKLRDGDQSAQAS